MAIVTGTAASETLNGTAGDDTIYGLAGNDSVLGGAGNDYLDGGAGDDTLLGGLGSDTLTGGAGNDTLDGGVVSDHLSYTDWNGVYYGASTDAVTVNLSGVTGTGSTGSGTATGSADGTDTLININGVWGSTFDDSIVGSSALIFEGFVGDLGDDTINGGAITDTLNGQNDNGVGYEYASGAVAVDLDAGTATGAAGNDTLININSIAGSEYDDELTGSDRIDVTEQFEGRGGDDTIDGAGGLDVVRYDGSLVAGGPPAGVDVNLATGIALDGFGGTDTLSNIEGVRGSNFADTLTGGNAVSDNLEFFQGRGGDDTIDGGSGYDRADYNKATAGVNVTLGGASTGTAIGDASVGTDTLINIEGVRGSSFADTLTGSNDAGIFESFEGREGNDTIDGMGGTDRVDYNASKAGVTVNLTTGIASDGYGGTDTLSNIEDVRGSRDFNDSLTGSALANNFYGQGGNDTLDGGAGNDSLYGGAGIDSVFGGAGNDWLDGGTGNDTLLGGLGTDTLVGGAGNDTLDGGVATDHLSYTDWNGVYYGASTAAVTVNLSGITGTGSTGFGTASGTADGTDTLININGVWGSAYNDSIVGSSALIFEAFVGDLGNDTINGGAITDTLNGANSNGVGYEYAAGAVTVNLATGTATGAAGNDTLININSLAGSGFDDVLTGSNRIDVAEQFEGRGGNDTIDGAGGLDIVRYDGSFVAGGSPMGVVVNLATGIALDGFGGTDTLSNIEGVRGSNFADNLIGSAGANKLEGLGGNDRLDGGAGNDTLLGGLGTDTLIGGAGNDTLDGGVVTDHLTYTDWNGVYYGASTAAVTVNLAGITGTGSTGSGTASGTADGTDTLININGVWGSTFNDSIVGSSALIFEAFVGDLGNDTIDGGAITDTLNGQNDNGMGYEYASGAVTVNLATGTASGAAGNDTLRNINWIAGSGFDDVLTGSDRTDLTEQFTGLAGDDTIDGAGGLDVVRYDGTLVAGGSPAGVDVNLATGIALDGFGGTDHLFNIEGVRGSNFADTLTGGNAANDNFEFFQGQGGNDTIDGGSGYDRADYNKATGGVNVTLGGAGTGTAIGNASVGTDTLISIEGVRGSSFADTLTGSNDVGIFESFEGREGNDLIDGLGGTDRADYNASTAGVTVNLTTGIAGDGYGSTDSLSNIEDVRGSRDFNDSLTGSAGANKLEGQGGNDTLIGNDGDDTLDGGLGIDSLVGGAGNDTYVIDSATDVVNESASGIDTVNVAFTAAGNYTVAANIENAVITTATASVNVTGNILNNTLTGNGQANSLAGFDGNDSLLGGAGNDTLTGGIGNDTLAGNAGDDVYVIDSLLDVVTEAAAEGTDRVETALLTSYTLGDDVENLTYTGLTAFTGTGNILNNSLVGAAGNDTLNGDGGNDTLIGNAGNDRLDGGMGDDSLVGGLGDDAYFVDSALDAVVEAALGGTDRIYTDLDSYTLLGGEVENLHYIGSSDFSGSGNIGNNSLTGAAGNDSLSGLAGNDTLTGNDGDDTLDGGLGIDSLVGGVGNDTYVIDSATDVVNESASGIDTVNVAFTAAGNYTVAANIENAVITTATAGVNVTGNILNNTLAGNGQANSLSGLDGTDSLVGGAGNDTLDGGTGNDSLLGGTGNDSMLGGTGDDLLNAGTGVDIADGGADNDTLVVLGNFSDYARSRPNATDTHLVNAVTGEDITLRNVESVTFLDGTKTLTEVQTNLATLFNDSIVGTVGSDTLDGLAGVDTLVGLDGDDTYVVNVAADVIIESADEDASDFPLNLPGIDQVNIAFTAAGTYVLGANVENAAITNATLGVNVTGNAENNWLVGNAAANVLSGLAGDDYLVGGLGSDTLIGGAGDDDYVVDVATDVITESAGEGWEEVNVSFALAGTYTLAANVEDAWIGNETLGVNVIGNAGNNQLDGNTTANSLSGLDGDDILNGWGGNDTLLGGTGDDTLHAGIGVDIADGGAGSDTLVALGDFADYTRSRVSETDTRLVNAATGENITLRGIENVQFLDGLKTLSEVWNNAVDNLSNSWTGTSGDDSINALTGSDTLSGLAGNDTLIGGVGSDSLIGGLGDDTFEVDVATDVVVELNGQGTDQVNINFALAGTYVMAAEVENATVTAGALVVVNVTGNELANIITGNAAANTILAGLGNDTLIGGAGSDSLVGGAGDDEYRIDVASDVVNEVLNGGGTDLVKIGFASTGSYTLTTDVENALVTSAGSSFAVNVTGNALGNAITGHAGANSLSGLGGDDTLIGGGGNDTIDGGIGNDTAVLDGVLIDYAISRPTTTQTIFTHLASGSTVSLSSVENINFAGDASTSTLASLIAQIGSIGNDTLTGLGADETLAGGLGNDSLIGGAGSDDLQGGDGLDTLNGGVGSDFLDGGLGNDTYQFTIGGGDDIIVQNDSALGSIDIVELASPIGDVASGETTLTRGWQSYDDLVITVNSGSPGAEGVDHIVVNNFITNDLVNIGTIDQIRFASNSTTLTQAQILSELLKGTGGDDWLRGYANTNDSITGGSGDDMIGGAAGNDTLSGGLGSDWLYGDAGADSVDGGAGIDNLFGGDGNDTLSGAGSDDFLTGGAGNDTYVFGTGLGNDSISDLGLAADVDVLKFGAGIRAVDVSVHRAGTDLTVTFSGAPTDSVVIEDYFAAGGRGQIEQFSFADGTSWSTAAIFAKALVPTSSNDYISGYMGSESLQGLAGDDTIMGNAGNDTLNGGDGVDWLQGGSGADRFVFHSAVTLANADHIDDFVSGTDKICLSASTFMGLLDVGAIGTTIGLSDNLTYNSANGELAYDYDGPGAGAAVTFATLDNHPATLGMDFMIVA